MLRAARTLKEATLVRTIPFRCLKSSEVPDLIRLLLCGSFIVLAPVQAFRQAARVPLTDQQKQGVSAGSKMKPCKFPDIPFPENWLGNDEKYRGAPIISFSIAPDGTTHDVKLKRSSGAPKIDKWAMDVVRAWKYKPTQACPGIDSVATLIIDVH